MTDTAEAPQSVGTVADEIMAAAIERNATSAAETPSAPSAAAKPPPAGFVDPLDESLFSDEALKDPATVRARAQLLREQVKEAQKIRSAAHNARAEAERREAKAKHTKQEALAEKSTARATNQYLNSIASDMESGDPARFVAGLERLKGVKDGNEYWRGIATHLATGKKPTRDVPPEVLELRAEVEALKQAKQAEIEQQTEAQIDAQLRDARIQQIETAKTYTDLPFVSQLSTEQPALVDARICDLRQQHYQRTGQPLDLRAACGMVEEEIRSHYELLQRTGKPSGQLNGERGAAAPVAGQAGTPERFAKPAMAPSTPKQQSTPQTLPSSLTAEPGATKRSLSEQEQRDAQIEAFDRLGLFANFGVQ
jgi:plasmid stability protein